MAITFKKGNGTKISSIKEKLKDLFKNKKKRPLIILLALALVAVLGLVFWLLQPKKPMMTYEDYLSMSQEILEMDSIATDMSKAWKGQREQLGDEAYDALVLGLPVEEGSAFYESQQKNFGSAQNEGRVAVGAFEEHEAEIRAMGGIVSYEDLAKLDTGEVRDPYAREVFKKILGAPEETTADISDEQLAKNREAAAYE